MAMSQTTAKARPVHQRSTSRLAGANTNMRSGSSETAYGATPARNAATNMRSIARAKLPPDPTLDQVLELIGTKSLREISERSNYLVSYSTLLSWRRRKVRRPVNYTLEAALKALGYERVIRKIKR